MSKYNQISVDKAYRLINQGPLVLVSTKSADGRYDIAPIAWNCPVSKIPSKILLAVGKSHQTYRNIKENGEFIVCVPNESLADFVRYSGSVSGADEDKFKKAAIDTEKGEEVDALIPRGLTGYMECEVDGEYDSGVSLLVGRAVKAGATAEAFTDRVRPENPDGRTLHHLGGGVFGILSEKVNENR